MVSYNEKKVPSQAEVETLRVYGHEAIKLVSGGYRRICSYFESIKARGEFRGASLREVLHKLPATPPLMTHDEFEELLKTSAGKEPYTDREALRIVRTILENVLNESMLAPALAFSRENNEIIVILR